MPDTMKIPLTRGLFAIVDAEDFYQLSKFKWQAKGRQSYTMYAVRTVRIGNGKRKDIPMHRSILMMPYSPKVDHRDGDGLNNRKSNLRPVTDSQNQANRRLDHDKRTSRFKGVHWDTRDKAWRAQIHVNGSKMSLGYFYTEVQAALAYDRAARKNFGEHARCNCPISSEF